MAEPKYTGFPAAWLVLVALGIAGLAAGYRLSAVPQPTLESLVERCEELCAAQGGWMSQISFEVERDRTDELRCVCDLEVYDIEARD